MQLKKIPTLVYSRVVGFYTPVCQWNKGKQSEFRDRRTFTVKSSTDAEGRSATC